MPNPKFGDGHIKRNILHLLATEPGLSNKEIAERAGTKNSTYVKILREKLAKNAGGVAQELPPPPFMPPQDTVHTIAPDTAPDTPETGKSLADRLKSFASDIVHGRHSDVPEETVTVSDFVGSFTPIVATIFAIMLSGLYPEPYQACAPSEDESLAFWTPIMSIVGRSFKANGRLSQTGMDIMACLAASLIYTKRALDTRREIKQLVDFAKRDPQGFQSYLAEQERTQHATGTNGGSGYSHAAAAHGNHFAMPTGSSLVQDTGAVTGNGAGVGGNGAKPGAIGPLSDVLAQDAEWRRANGYN